MFNQIKEDVKTVLERDPAANGALEIILLYPGFHALLFHRISHRLWIRGFRLLGRFVSQIGRLFTGVEIHPGAVLGRRFFIDHGMGVVIGETAEVGDDVTIYHQVTLGGTSSEKKKRHPTVQDHVTIGAGAAILGPVIVGNHSKIGSGSVVVHDVPPYSTVVGIPGRIVRRDPTECGENADLEHGQLPEVQCAAVDSLADRVQFLQKEIDRLRDELQCFESDRKKN